MNQQKVKAVVEDLERVLLAFMRKHQITHEEYRHATALLVATVKAGEESLLYDVFLEAEATNIGSAGRAGSLEALEGPFYLPGAPALSRPCMLPQRDEEQGDVLFFNGRITGPTGQPLAGVELDIWQADAEGLYSNIHPGIPDWNLRGRIVSAGDGTFEVQTIVPPPYEIPKGGPTGRILKALGRHFFRPAHLHLKVRHPGYQELTTQLYFEGDRYLDSDVASGVRDGLITSLMRRESAAELAARGLREPYFELTYDLVLAPERAPQAVALA